MLGGRIRRRALALLGALLLVILVWPPCFASMPATGRLPPPPASVDPRDLVLPPARPHPAAIMLPVPLPLQPVHTGGTRALRRRRQQRPTEAAATADEERDPRGSRPQPLSEFRRFMRVLNLTTDATGDIEDAHRHPHTRRQYSTTTTTSSANQVTVNSDDSGGSGSPPPPQLVLNLRQPHENSPPAGHDYLIEPFDKNKPQSVAANTTRRKFDDTPPAADDREEGGAVIGGEAASQRRPAVSRRRSKRTAASANPHRHQHKLAPVSGMTNGTGAHHHRGRGGGGGRHQHHQPKPQPQPQQQSNNESNLERNERSANLSHISGATRKIQLFIKNRYIQLLPDGTVNGTHDDLSNYTILQRTTVGIGQIKIQAVATCLFLCMDTCGSVYGSKEFTDDCIFNEQMEQHHYNTYSSTQHSNARRTLYLALNKTGQPRKIQIPVNRTLGKLATYTKALTQTVAHDRVEQLISRLFGADHVRHGLNQLCETGQPLEELTAKEMRPRPVCQGGGGGPKGPIGSSPASGASAKQTQSNASKEGPRQKKKKKRRKCQEDEVPGEHCFRPGGAGPGVGGTNSGNSGKKKGGQNQGQSRGGSSSSISSGSSSGPSISSSSVGSSSSSTDQFGPGSVSNGSISVGSLVSSSSSSSSSSISNGGPNRQGLPVAPLSTTPNVRKSAKQTKKVPGSGGVRSGSPATGPGGSGQARKPKKPTQQAAASGGKRNGTTGGGQPVRGPPAKGKLVPVSSVMIARVSPKPASLMIGRSPRITTPFTTTTTTTTSTARSPTTSRTTSETTPFASQLEDTSQQLEDSVNDSELDMADVLLLQTSTELADEDELDEGSPTASSWHELLPTSSISEQQSGCYRGLSCSSFILSLGPLVVTGATVHLLYL